MAKYSFEFKKKVVEEYLLGRGSTHELAKNIILESMVITNKY